MSTLADSIRRGLEQAIDYAEGKADMRDYRISIPKRIDVKAIRTRLAMTQEEIDAARAAIQSNQRTVTELAGDYHIHPRTLTRLLKCRCGK